MSRSSGISRGVRSVPPAEPPRAGDDVARVHVHPPAPAASACAPPPRCRWPRSGRPSVGAGDPSGGTISESVPCTVETLTPTFSNTRPRMSDITPPPPPGRSHALRSKRAGARARCRRPPLRPRSPRRRRRSRPAAPRTRPAPASCRAASPLIGCLRLPGCGRRHRVVGARARGTRGSPRSAPRWGRRWGRGRPVRPPARAPGRRTPVAALGRRQGLQSFHETPPSSSRSRRTSAERLPGRRPARRGRCPGPRSRCRGSCPRPPAHRRRPRR